MQRGVLGHSTILDAMRAKDPARAEVAMRDHLGASAMYLRALADIPRQDERAAPGPSTAT
jgi:DNA-binding FadR family transcriptional regulator